MKKYLLCRDVTKVLLERMDAFPEEFYEEHAKFNNWMGVYREVLSSGNLFERGYLRRALKKIREGELMKGVMAAATYEPQKKSSFTVRITDSTIGVGGRGGSRGNYYEEGATSINTARNLFP